MDANQHVGHSGPRPMPPRDGDKVQARQRAKRQSGPGNPNWKGGRSVASNGYVLIKMPEHPDADSRGYVYEHRLIAEQKIGRRLLSEERVHHVNHVKTDNRPENLEVTEDIAHHLAHHRKRTDLKSPDAPNEDVLCACGCGQVFAKYDRYGRPRRFITGHNNVERHHG